MTEYRAPGVFIEEIERGPRPIEGVPTHVTALLGVTERGPLAPTRVTSALEFARRFGAEFDAQKFLPSAAAGFFENGGKQLVVCRVMAADAVPARHAFGDWVLSAVGPGQWGNQVVAVIDVRGADRFRLRLSHRDLAEEFDGLSLDPESPDHYARRLGTADAPRSTLAWLDGGQATALPPGAGPINLAGGSDGSPAGSGDFARALGLLSDDRFRDVALVCAPHAGAEAAGVHRLLIEHCERQRFRFAVLDCEPGIADPRGVDPAAAGLDTPYAALYLPWVYVPDAASGARRLVPPGGHVLGVYARTDIERGVFKAPANEVLRGVVALEYEVDHALQQVLNPRGIDVIRRFPNRGIRVWGARTLSSNSPWKYVSVRRLFIFLERSIYEGTQWTVFEPNGESLWARLKDTIRLFLRAQWRAGALFGTREEEAFFITCDRTTMTQDDILNGRLICEVGVAPLRPAEFVILRFFMRAAEPTR